MRRFRLYLRLLPASRIRTRAPPPVRSAGALINATCWNHPEAISPIPVRGKTVFHENQSLLTCLMIVSTLRATQAPA